MPPRRCWQANLIRLANAGADNRDGVFQRDPRNWRIEQQPDELQCRLLLRSSASEPACAGNGEVVDVVDVDESAVTLKDEKDEKIKDTVPSSLRLCIFLSFYLFIFLYGP